MDASTLDTDSKVIVFETNSVDVFPLFFCGFLDEFADVSGLFVDGNISFPMPFEGLDSIDSIEDCTFELRATSVANGTLQSDVDGDLSV